MEIMTGKQQTMKPRYEHRDSLIMWKVIDHTSATWSKWSGLGFADYYYVQHRIFKRMKRIKCFGYRPKDHPLYNDFKAKHGIE